MHKSISNNFHLFFARNDRGRDNNSQHMQKSPSSSQSEELSIYLLKMATAPPLVKAVLEWFGSCGDLRFKSREKFVGEA